MRRQNALPCSGYSYRSLNFSNSVAGVQRHSLSPLIEFAALTQLVTAGVNPLAVLLDEFINRYMRNNNISLNHAHQSIYQLDEHLRNTVLSLGNMVVGRVATINS